MLGTGWHMASNRAALVWKPQPGRQERRTIAFPRRLTGLIGRLWHRPSRPSPPPPSATAFDALELDCLRGVLAPEALQAAARRSAAIGVGADQVLIQCGAIDEDAYLHHLAAHCGIRIETFSALRREDCPLSDAQLHYAGRYGLVPVLREGRHDYIQILVGLSARRISELALKYPAASRNCGWRAGATSTVSSPAMPAPRSRRKPRKACPRAGRNCRPRPPR